jgi:carbamoyltransferase
MPNVIGISAFYHDSACCLIRNGQLIAAAQEERFSRRKHDPSFPTTAFAFCLQQGGITIADVDCVAYYEDPMLKFQRQLCMKRNQLSEHEVIRLWRSAWRPERQIREVLGYSGRVHFVPHHLAHAASAFYYSGFDEAALFTVDGVGEWATTTYGIGDQKAIQILEEVQFPDSLGLLYSTITNYLGFSVNDGEYKVMGLAPYGRPVFRHQVRRLLCSEPGGQYRLDLQFFDFTRNDRMYTESLCSLFDHPPRLPETEIEQFHKDLASSLQIELEELLIEKVDYLHSLTGTSNLCLAGGVALNCVAMGRLRTQSRFTDIFIQPAAGDAGGALGAAALAHLAITVTPIENKRLSDVYLGPAYSSAHIRKLLNATSVLATDFSCNYDALLDAAVNFLVSGKVIAWFAGRMEFGPRALGSRSILADPRLPGMRDRINRFVKRREAFRPFAPAVLAEEASKFFELSYQSPFMLETCRVRSEYDLPAITHVDGSARVQTVGPDSNSRFRSLLAAFGARTGYPILLNTSFNMRDEPIVCTPIDALLSFAQSDIDALVLEDFVVERAGVPPYWKGLSGRETGKVSAIDSVYRMT